MSGEQCLSIIRLFFHQSSCTYIQSPPTSAFTAAVSSRAISSELSIQIVRSVGDGCGVGEVLARKRWLVWVAL